MPLSRMECDMTVQTAVDSQKIGHVSEDTDTERGP